MIENFILSFESPSPVVATWELPASYPLDDALALLCFDVPASVFETSSKWPPEEELDEFY